MTSFFQRLFPKQPSQRPSHARLVAAEWPAIIYAIGDVHGCCAELDRLQNAVIADAAAVEGDKWIVMIGDYVDRGPRSAGVLDTLCAAPPSGFRRFCLAGNHEVMMRQFLDHPTSNHDWLQFGGIETLLSYGIDLNAFNAANLARRKMILESHIPREHIEFLDGLPVMLSLPDTVFVHAGLAPNVPLDQQSENDLLWIREPFLSEPGVGGRLVVHGHTPVAIPEILPHRIGIDTGAFATGVLTAACLQQGCPPRFLDTR